MASPAVVEDAYARLHPRLWHALFALTGDADSASESTRRTFQELIDTDAPVDHVDAWLCRRAHELVPEPEPEPDGDGARAAASAPPAVAELLDVLDELSTDDRCCVILRYVADLRSPEIGAILGIDASIANTRLHHAREQLWGDAAPVRPPQVQTTVAAKPLDEAYLQQLFATLDQMTAPDTWAELVLPEPEPEAAPDEDESAEEPGEDASAAPKVLGSIDRRVLVALAAVAAVVVAVILVVALVL